MSLRKIQIVSDVSAQGIISYNITHNVGSLFATCTVEMLTTYALSIDDELTLENEKFRVTQINKKPHRRGSPRVTSLSGRSLADVFQFTTIDNSLMYYSFVGLKQDHIFYDGFDSPEESELFKDGQFHGNITKGKKCGCFGHNGWTAHEVMKDLIDYTQVAKVEISCMDYDVLQVNFSAGMAVADGARQLFGMFKPFIFAQAPAQSEGDEDAKPTLYIIPTSDPQDYQWPGGPKIDQNVTEQKLDNQFKMVIIEGGIEEDPNIPNPCEPGCPGADVERIVNNWQADDAEPLVDTQDFIDRTAYELKEDLGDL